MLVQISHERSQALLRQRNLFALTSAGLAIALIVAGGFAATRNREVVLVPTVRAPLTVSSAGVSAQYLEFVTRDAALNEHARTPPWPMARTGFFRDFYGGGAATSRAASSMLPCWLPWPWRGSRPARR